MARVTADEVREIFNTSLDEDKILACVNIANIMVTQGPATSTSPQLLDTELKEIERWLAAHFSSIQDPIALRVKIGDSTTWHFPESVTTAWGSGLKLTPYGQMAIAMDRSGILAKTGLMKGSYRAARREDSAFYTRNLTKDGL